MTKFDLSAVKAVIDATALFPSSLLDDMTADAFNGVQADEQWIVFEEGSPIAVAYYAPEKMTEGTWNLYLIAVHPDQQGKGVGTQLLKNVETTLTQQSQRVLLVETSGLDDFEQTRQFYVKNGYEREACIREFYAAGEDKIVFRKAL